MKGAHRTFRQFLPELFTCTGRHTIAICPNMPLRFLLYLAAEYEALVSKMGENIYGKKLILLPAPECVVFYNGDEEIADEQYLCLTNAFVDEHGKKRNSCMELTVRVLNINYGHNEKLTKVCGRLEEYACFVAKIKEFRQGGQYTEQAVDNAMLYCIDHGILEDILLPFRAEVKRMLLTEYNEKKYMRMFRKEAREEGLEEGRQEGLKEGLREGIQKGQNQLIKTMLQKGVSAETISEQTGLSLQEIMEAEREA